jgi:hypothetical protein
MRALVLEKQQSLTLRDIDLPLKMGPRGRQDQNRHSRDLRQRRALLRARAHWLQGAFGEADIVGQLVSECLRMDDLRREAAVNRRCRPEGYAWVDVV